MRPVLRRVRSLLSHALTKVDALFEYHNWLNNKFINNKYKNQELNLDLINTASKNWFLRSFVALGGIPFRKILKISRRLDKIFDNGLTKNILVILLINLYAFSRSIFRLNG